MRRVLLSPSSSRTVSPACARTRQSSSKATSVASEGHSSPSRSQADAALVDLVRIGTLLAQEAQQLGTLLRALDLDHEFSHDHSCIPGNRLSG